MKEIKWGKRLVESILRGGGGGTARKLVQILTSQDRGNSYRNRNCEVVMGTREDPLEHSRMVERRREERDEMKEEGLVG